MGSVLSNTVLPGCPVSDGGGEIPAFAGMTWEGAGMTWEGVGMTAEDMGVT